MSYIFVRDKNINYNINGKLYENQFSDSQNINLFLTIGYRCNITEKVFVRVAFTPMIGLAQWNTWTDPSTNEKQGFSNFNLPDLEPFQGNIIPWFGFGLGYKF